MMMIIVFSIYVKHVVCYYHLHDHHAFLNHFLSLFLLSLLFYDVVYNNTVNNKIIMMIIYSQDAPLRVGAVHVLIKSMLASVMVD